MTKYRFTPVPQTHRQPAVSVPPCAKLSYGEITSTACGLDPIDNLLLSALGLFLGVTAVCVATGVAEDILRVLRTPDSRRRRPLHDY